MAAAIVRAYRIRGEQSSDSYPNGQVPTCGN
jgi:hypothetical protein